jgi:hypothetical protein
MKYPKSSCAVVVMFAGLVALSYRVGAAEPKGSAAQANNSASSAAPATTEGRSESSPPISAAQHTVDSKGSAPHSRDASGATTASPGLRPAPPSNVRIKVQTSYPPGHAAVAVPGTATPDPSSLPTGRSRTPVAAALDAQNFASTFRSATAATRGKLLTDVESRLAVAEAALAEVEKSTPEMSAGGREQFKSATNEARAKAKALRKSMDVAHGATEEEWEGARAQVAADYHAYAAALSRIDGAMGVAPPGR